MYLFLWCLFIIKNSQKLSKWRFYLVLMHMHLFLWCFFMVKNYQKIRFLFSVNVYAFVPMVLFLWLKIVRNCQNWVYREWVRFFYLRFKKLSERAAKYTAYFLRICNWLYISNRKTNCYCAIIITKSRIAESATSCFIKGSCTA